VLIVGVEIEFAVAVGDLMERPEVEDEVVGIGRINPDEATSGVRPVRSKVKPPGAPPS
jgi:hypothetical protein